MAASMSIAAKTAELASPQTSAEVPAPHRARAYRGAAHGLTWSLPLDRDPPEVAGLAPAGDETLYRIVRNPRSGRLARDHHGNFLYVPVPQRRSI